MYIDGGKPHFYCAENKEKHINLALCAELAIERSPCVSTIYVTIEKAEPLHSNVTFISLQDLSITFGVIPAYQIYLW